MAKKKKKRVLFYYLSAFSNTGGIEKFNRCFINALNGIASEGEIVPSIVSVYDRVPDERYINLLFFRGFGKQRLKSLGHVLKQAFKSDVLILGHINLAVAGWLVKIFHPKCKVYIVAHGIEVWSKMFFIKKWAVKSADLLLCVSNYTKNQLVLRNQLNPLKLGLFPNTIDPYFDLPEKPSKPEYLFKRYGISKDAPVIMTLSRLVSSEKYKGYDKVIEAFPIILQRFPNAKYLLAGKYDEGERQRVENLILKYNLAGRLILTGYVNETEVTDHYCMADVFIMPSRKEGFGIVFLEALACGSRVIGGNQDGTVDALYNGALGKLINPTKTMEISAAVIDFLSSPKPKPEALQTKVLEHYRFERYQERLKKYLE